MACLKEVFPLVKKNWLISVYGVTRIKVVVKDQPFMYTPRTVFEKDDGVFRTVTFDTAHLVNLLREGAAKGKLNELGLTSQSLHKLSGMPDYSYLKKILKLKNGSLFYDPMNQSSSYKLFSEDTEKGLKDIGDLDGARCCKVIREGLIESLDISGISSEVRCWKLFKFKCYLDSKINMLNKISKPGVDQISAELVQMLYCTLDSHIVNYINLEFFNPRRKSTGSVEQFFSQITLMNDGGLRLNCSALSDILKRVAITNSLRLMPDEIKGFSFLKHLNVHMKSYNQENENDNDGLCHYPRMTKFRPDLTVYPSDSQFDKKRGSKKRKVYSTICNVKQLFDGCVRQFHHKF